MSLPYQAPSSTFKETMNDNVTVVTDEVVEVMYGGLLNFLFFLSFKEVPTDDLSIYTNQHPASNCALK